MVTHGFDMNHSIPALLALIVTLIASPLHAACYADYKAKMDSPLRLHYGVMEIPDSACSVADAAEIVAPRVASHGWQLLEVMSVFDDAGLAERRDDAGQFFLSF